MNLNHKIIGTGDPFFILHGLFGTLDNWYSIAKLLSTKYQVILVDQRNHGKSPHSSEWNYNVMAEDLNRLMSELRLDSATILGHSMGGKTAMTFAHKYGNMVKNLVVVDIGPKYYKPHHGEIIDALKSLNFDAITTRGEADKSLSTKLADAGVRQFLLKNLDRKRDGGFRWQMNLDTIIQNIDEVGKPMPETIIYKEKCLFIRGDKSDYIKEEDLEGIRLRFPQYKLATISNAGHWVHAEQPTTFYNTLIKYLTNES